MDKPIPERRRLVQLLFLGSVALPVAALAGCVQGAGVRRPPSFGGGSNAGDKSGGGGGGGRGSR